MERSGYRYSYKDNVSGPGQGVPGERVITETEKESGYSVKCCGCIPLCFDRTNGPLLRNDMSTFARPTGWLRILQLIPLIIAFVAVELALWCYFGLRAYTFFSTVTMCLIWFNVLFLFIYICQCQWRMRCFDCYLLDIFYHIVAIILLLISSIFLSLRVCSTGHIVGAVFGFIAALMYLLSLAFLIREYQQFRKTKAQEKAWKNYYGNVSTVRGAQPGSPSTRYYPTPPPNMGQPGDISYANQGFQPPPSGPLPPTNLYPDTVDYYTPPGGPSSQGGARQIPIHLEQQPGVVDYYRMPPPRPDPYYPQRY